MKRREFISKSLYAGIAAGTSVSLLAKDNYSGMGGTVTVNPLKEVQQKPQGKMKVGLYSITYLGIWYKDRPLTWQETLQRAKDFGYDGVEFDAKRPHANPMDWNQDTRKAVVNRAGELGLELPVLAGNNNFASPVPEDREAQLLMVREQIKLAADLGCKILRIFGAWPGITFRDGWATYDESFRESDRAWAGVPRMIRWNHMKECITEAAKIAGDYGVILALQNHPPIVRNWRDAYDMILSINSPNLKICFDIPHNEDSKENVTAAINTIGNLDVHFHYNGEFKRLPDGKIVGLPTVFGEPIQNYPHIVNELARIGYDGYLCWEFCHNVTDSKGNPGTLREVDEQTQLALEYMRSLVADAEKLYKR